MPHVVLLSQPCSLLGLEHRHLSIEVTGVQKFRYLAPQGASVCIAQQVVHTACAWPMFGKDWHNFVHSILALW